MENTRKSLTSYAYIFWFNVSEYDLMFVKEYQGASQLSQVKPDPVNVKRSFSAHQGMDVTTRNIFCYKAQLLMGLKKYK